jgi:hypothetical protein
MSTLDPNYYNAQVIQSFQQRLQIWRWLLVTVVSGFCTSIAFARNIGDWIVLPFPPLSFRLLGFAVFILNQVNRRIWSDIFRDPSRLFGHRRPSRQYQRAAYLTLLLTTVPNLVLQIWLCVLGRDLWLQSRWARNSLILQILLYILLCTLVWWQAKIYLLEDDGEENFEPTTQLECNSFVPYSDDYSDELPVISLSQDNLDVTIRSFKAAESSSYLAIAHAQQLKVFSDQRTLLDLRNDATESPHEPITTTLAAESSATNQTTTKCMTTARFDYMPESRYGPHSWLQSYLCTISLVVGGSLHLVLTTWLSFTDMRTRFESR